MDKLHKHNRFGFTIVELLVIIVVIGILSTVGVIGYGAWRQSIAEKEVVSDLKGVASAMESARNWGEGYPTSLPSSFVPSENVELSYYSGDAKEYCIDGFSKKYPTITYFVKNDQDPQAGNCVMNQTEDFEDDNLAFSFSGDWTRTSATAHTGLYSYTNKDIDNSQSSQTQIVVNLKEASTVSFYYKVSSETNFDFFRFSIDGTEQLKKSGTIDWTQVSYNLSAGSHTLIWRYTKDGSVSNGSDSGYIDDLTISGS